MSPSLPTIPLIGFILVAAVVTIWLLMQRGRGDADGQRRSSETLRTALHVKQAGNYLAAEDLLRSALDSLDQSAKDGFALKTSVLQHLAHCCAQNGNWEDSRKFYDELLEWWRKGLERPTAEILTDIDYSASSGEFGASSEAVADLYNAVIEAKRKLYGPAHMEVIHSMLVRANLLRRVVRLDEARALESEVEALKEALERTKTDKQ